MTDQQAEIDLTVSLFYRTGRAGAPRLSDGGGPFGFDIAAALMVDELIRHYGCDAIAETGSFAGDTTFYLARRYPRLPVYSCDIDRECAAFTARRLAGCPNAEVTCEDSTAKLARVASRHARPLAFLDAHWGEAWPLLTQVLTELDGMPFLDDGFASRRLLALVAALRHGAASAQGLAGGVSREEAEAWLAPARAYLVNAGPAPMPARPLRESRKQQIAAVLAGLAETMPAWTPLLSIPVRYGRLYPDGGAISASSRDWPRQRLPAVPGSAP
jgi:hypothetical protein